jgi:hypothetical protein
VGYVGNEELGMAEDSLSSMVYPYSVANVREELNKQIRVEEEGENMHEDEGEGEGEGEADVVQLSPPCWKWGHFNFQLSTFTLQSSAGIFEVLAWVNRQLYNLLPGSRLCNRPCVGSYPAHR